MNFDNLLSFISEEVFLKKETLNSETRFRETIDSLDYVELVMHLEEKLNIEISDEDAERINTIGELFDFLKSKGVAK